MTSSTSTRGLLYSSAIYGIADAMVLAAGGLFLLPLYMRTLSQAEFGNFVIVKTNAELFTYLLFMGLPSAAARVYFDHRKSKRQTAYMGSVVNLFLINSLILGGACLLWGEWLWRRLSPATPTMPYLWFSVAIAAAGFFATIGPLWLRLENRVHLFVAVQLASALTLVVTAVVALSVLHWGLPGVVGAILLSSACSSLLLPWQFGREYRPRVEIDHVTESLRFAAPVVVGYVAYFVLNRAGTLILQRHVLSDQIAIFGLAQQLAMIVTIFGNAFGKAMQPAVYAANADEVTEILNRSGRTLIFLMLGFTSVAMLFSWEALTLVAPKAYAPSFEIFLMLAWSNLAYSFALISNTALYYHRKPKTSVVLTITGAALSAVLCLWLVPRLQLRGAAIATATAFAVTSFGGQLITRRLTGHSLIGRMLLALAIAALMALLAWWLQASRYPMSEIVAVKLLIVGVLGLAMYKFVHADRTVETRAK